MKIILTWEETWVREAPYEVDEKAYLDWLEGEKPTNANLRDFVLAGRTVPEPEDLLPTRDMYPGKHAGDRFDYHEITKARRA